MEINIKVNLLNKKQMDLEYIHTAMAQFIKDYGKMIFLKDMVSKFGRMDQNIKAILKLGYDKEKEHI